MRPYRITAYNRTDPGLTRTFIVEALTLWSALEQFPEDWQPFEASARGDVRPDTWEDLTDLLREIIEAQEESWAAA